VILEFAFSSLLLIPVVLGSAALGLGLVYYLQVLSVCRSTGSMFVRGADFSQPAMQRVLLRVAAGLGLGSTTAINPDGRTVVIVTQLMRVGAVQCSDLPSGQTCTNRGRVVIIKQLRLGNRALRASDFGSPGGTQTSDGSYDYTYYLTNSQAAVSAFGLATADDQATPGAPVDLHAGELSYASEVYMSAANLNPFPGVMNISGFYRRNFF
jgi:hypothetical protein